MRGFLLIILIIFLNINCSDKYGPPSNPNLGGDQDLQYRVGIYPSNGQPMLPSHHNNWTLEYKYIIPPIPSGNWNYQNQTVYTYGQIDFDQYGSGGKYTISDYMYNQIVPQVMIGNCLDSNDSQYNPYWHLYQHWVIQAQYYWMNSGDTSFSLCGNIVQVDPGEELTTKISYSASTGKITASISGLSGASTIVIHKPFLNDTLFTDWSQFFSRAELQSNSTGAYGNTALNVETHYLNALTICSMLPFHVNLVAIPGIPWANGNYLIQRIGSYHCLDTMANMLAILHY
jgi:hypothetical protein